jgi:hypothetical protein
MTASQTGPMLLITGAWWRRWIITSRHSYLLSVKSSRKLSPIFLLLCCGCSLKLRCWSVVGGIRFMPHSGCLMSSTHIWFSDTAPINSLLVPYSPFLFFKNYSESCYSVISIERE